jgi:hypothetical protein
MNNKEITLKDFFSFTEKDLSALESTDGMSRIKEALQEKAKEIKWPMAFDEIAKKIDELLNIDFSDIMVRAWDKYRILLKYRDRGKYPPTETFLVPLGEHTIKSQHHPYIEILINDTQVGKIVFNINISLSLKEMILKIQDGRIKGIRTGTCKGKGSVKLEDIVIMERETESIQLPGTIDFAEGVIIA